MCALPIESVLRLGSWIGGDRDGNPNVCSSELGLSLALASETVLSDYLGEVHALGAELSISTELARTTPAVLALAERSGDDAPARDDEPYRRALSGIYARLAATYRATTGREPARPTRLDAGPYPDPSAFRADRSEEHTSELQSLMRNSYAVLCL